MVSKRFPGHSPRPPPPPLSIIPESALVTLAKRNNFAVNHKHTLLLQFSKETFLSIGNHSKSLLATLSTVESIQNLTIFNSKVFFYTLHF